MKKILYLFTAEYPYGRAESFLENEVPVLEKHFASIVVFPMVAKTNEKRATTNNNFVHPPINNRPDLNTKKIFRKNVFYLFSVLFAELINSPKPFYFFTHLRYFNSILMRGIYDSEKIKALLRDKQENIIFYSYWLNDWALALAILKQKGVIDKFVVRCSGFDIYDERNKGNILPFRYFVYKHTAGVYPNSLDGANYIKNKKCFSEKVKLHYLGTNDYGLNPFNGSGKFTIVSCSNVIPLKRVDLIVEILKNITFELNWIHFGDGVCIEEVLKNAQGLPSNISFDFRGRVPNKEVNEFYKTHSVNLFITTSETESLPVSLQEAISFGIPIVATNVGGIAEIANERTGYLIDKDVDVLKIAQLISDFKKSVKNKIEFRRGVREFWINNFEAQRNYSLFCEEIIKI